uniref:Holin n=1 Tax=Dulem virus 34 TaxID=3145752 RepID=A0AAU8B8Y5_9CAUD
MEIITQYIPLAISAILLAALILTVATNIITQVLKKLTWDKLPTNILAVIVAMVVTLLAFFAVCEILGVAVAWYMVAGAVALGLFVAYAAMFGFDKLREALEQITNWNK